MAFVDGLVECEFVEYLTRSLELELDAPIQGGAWSRIGNTIGALTLRLKLMSESQVDQVLEVQDAEGGYFGEIAVRNGFLTREEVHRLLEIQRLHDQLHLGEQLVMTGKLDISSLVQQMAGFLSERAPEP